MPKISTLKSLHRLLLTEKYDRTGVTLITEDYDTGERSRVEEVDLDEDARELVFTVRREQQD